MERIGVVGASVRRGGPGVLALFGIPAEERAQRLPALAWELDAEELVYLGTCNRVEVAFRLRKAASLSPLRARVFAALAGREPRPGEAERALQAWAGEGAVEHLLLVAAGLDSAALGEREIRVQVRDALLAAREAAAACGGVLEQVLIRALRVASEVHRQVEGDGQGTSLADRAAERLAERLRRTPGSIALVGVSPMTRRCGRLLVATGCHLFVVNRTAARAAQLAAELGAEARDLASFLACPDPVEALLTATGSPGALFRRAELERLAARTPSGQPLLVVDLGVPADVDAEAARLAGLERIGIDEVTRLAAVSRQRRLVELAPARELVDRGLADLRRELAERRLAPVLARLGQRYRETATAGVERLFRRELAGLGEAEREAVRRWAEVLARRFAHLPTLGLRALAAQESVGAVGTFLAASDEDLARVLAVAGDGPAGRGEAPGLEKP